MFNIKKTVLLSLTALLTIAFSGCKKKEDLSSVDCSTLSAKYSADIVPIVNATCNKSGCHNAGSSNGDYTAYAGLKAKADNGSLKKRIVTKQNMPKKGTLTAEERGKFKCWIESGAPQN